MVVVMVRYGHLALAVDRSEAFTNYDGANRNNVEIIGC